jgi:hypothetical protein
MDPIFVKTHNKRCQGADFFQLQQNVNWQRVDNIAKVFRNNYTFRDTNGIEHDPLFLIKTIILRKRR